MEFKKYGRPSTEAQRTEIVTALAQRVGFASADDLYNTIGYGGISVSKIALRLREEFDKVIRPESLEPTVVPTEADQIRVAQKPRKLRQDSGIVVDGEYGCQVKFAKCCNPLPGDRVIGFITKGFGMSIHKVDCPNVETGMKKPEYRDRWVEAHWDMAGKDSSAGVYEAHVQVFAYSSLTILADITMALADMKVLLLQINTQKKSDGQIIINLKISCKNVDHYHSIVSRLKSLNDVIDVTRGYT